VPWSALCALIEPFYPKPGHGRPPIGIERMLRSCQAIDSYGHGAARNPQRLGDRPLSGATLVLEAQDLSYTSHRHSLGWHRFPHPSSS
jgi:hypothetical protein